MQKCTEKFKSSPNSKKLIRIICVFYMFNSKFLFSHILFGENSNALHVLWLRSRHEKLIEIFDVPRSNAGFKYLSGHSLEPPWRCKNIFLRSVTQYRAGAD